jgi:hypothetical protein
LKTNGEKMSDAKAREVVTRRKGMDCGMSGERERYEVREICETENTIMKCAKSQEHCCVSAFIRWFQIKTFEQNMWKRYNIGGKNKSEREKRKKIGGMETRNTDEG